MTTLTLVCVCFYETAMQFSVEIAGDAKISTLLEAVFSQLPPAVRERYDVLQVPLFVAKDANGQWIELEDVEAELHRAAVDPSHLVRLWPARLLSHEKCFGQDPALGEDKVHVLVVLPGTTIPKREIKRQKVEHVKRVDLEGLWSYSDMERESMPSIHKLRDFLLRPIPFRLTSCIDYSRIRDACDSEGPQISCAELESFVNVFVLTAKAARREPPSSVRAWQTLYDTLLQIPTELCAATGLRFEGGRNAAATCEHDNSGGDIRPDLVLQYAGIVYLRGEERSRCRVWGREDSWVAVQQLTAKMRGWNQIFYGDLPYILGYATAGDQVQIMVIEPGEHAGDPVRTLPLVRFSVYDDVTTALKVFFNLASVLSLMTDHSPRIYKCPLFPFVPSITEKRKIELLDGVIERTITSTQIGAGTFERLVGVYKALQSLNSLGSEVTHLQTVERLTILDDTDRRSDRLVVQLAPVGVSEIPDADSVRAWLGSMLIALKHLHACGYCHGDVAWRNIVRVPTTGSGHWVLIDMDECRAPNTETIHWSHPFRGELLMFRHDLYQLGRLVSKLPRRWTAAMRSVEVMLLAAEQERDVTIDGVLREFNRIEA